MEILNGAEAALLAEEAEFIERGRAFALHAQALRHEQEALFKRHRGEGLAPDLVAHQHAYVVGIDRIIAAILHKLVHVNAQFIRRDGRHQRGNFQLLADGGEDLITLKFRLGDVLLRGAEATHGDGHLRGKLSGTDGDSGHENSGKCRMRVSNGAQKLLRACV